MEGSRHLSLRVGSDDSDGWRAATYRSGTGTLVFEYTVVENNSDSNGVNAFLPHGQDIKATGTDVAYQPNPGGVTPTMGEDSNHKVNGSLVAADITSPTISSVSFADSPGPGEDDTYGVGDWVGVWVTFNESVLTTGAPQVELNISGTSRMSQYGHLSGGRVIDPRVTQVANSTLVFGYTVQEGDVDSDGISIGSNAVILEGLRTIEDRRGNDALLTHDALPSDSAHKVDAPDVTGPTVSSVAFTSDPGDDDAYGAGDAIQVTVTFSENMTVTGAPQLEIDVGGTAKTAYYSSASGATVVYSYAVAVGDADTDGISIVANKLTLNGGTINDAHRNAATQTHDAVAADTGHLV